MLAGLLHSWAQMFRAPWEEPQERLRGASPRQGSGASPWGNGPALECALGMRAGRCPHLRRRWLLGRSLSSGPGLPGQNFRGQVSRGAPRHTQHTPGWTEVGLQMPRLGVAVRSSAWPGEEWASGGGGWSRRTHAGPALISASFPLPGSSVTGT